MSDPSRRGFLKVAGAGVAGAGVAAAVTTTAAGTTTEAAVSPASLPAAAKREILVHVRDVHTGAISLMVEGREVTVHDRDLAARIAGATHTSLTRPTTV